MQQDSSDQYPFMQLGNIYLQNFSCATKSRVSLLMAKQEERGEQRQEAATVTKGK
jgi:hypothetical protein